MKNLVNMMAYAAIVILGVFLNMSLCACSEDYSDMEQVTPTPPPTPRDTTHTTPTPTDTTKWSWNGLIRSDLTFDTTTEMVSAYNIGQISNPNRVVFDSIPLVYHLGVELKAPKRVVVMSQDTTVLGNARTATTLNYGEYVRTAKDSVCSVSTGHTFPTSYYNIEATTTSKRGYSIHAGHWEPFKFVTEKAQWSRIWHEKITEVTINDSVFNREVVHNELVFKVTSNKGNSWYINREEVVIVDHFLKIREEEKEDDKINADVWVDGLGRMVSLTRGIREDSRNPCDFALFEGSTGYTIIIDTHSTDGKYLSTETDFHSFDECPKSNDYDGVAYIKGRFYPGAITYDYKESDEGSHDWVVTCYINGNVERQRISGQDVVMRGIKNFKEGNTAYPWPYLTNTSTSKEVNGKKVITVNGKTSEGRAVKQHIVADSSLK